MILFMILIFQYSWNFLFIHNEMYIWLYGTSYSNKAIDAYFCCIIIAIS